MFTDDELAFLESQNLTVKDVYDGRNQFAVVRKASARAAGLTLVLGTPCRNGGHRLRTRAGHCAQCDTKKLSYQKRHRAPGYVYIAGSRTARLLKVGTAIDIQQRNRKLCYEAYGGFHDWVMLFSAKIENAGKTEGDALRILKKFKVVRIYNKDGLQQNAEEMLQTSFSNVMGALSAAIGESKQTESWKSPRWADYEFKQHLKA